MNKGKIKITRTMLNTTLPHTTVSDLAITLDSLMAALLEDEKTWTFETEKPWNKSDVKDVKAMWMAKMALIDLSAWSRIDEVYNYARFHDIDVPTAIERLVNSGLSHENRGWTS